MLTVSGLRKTFNSKGETVQAIDDVSFDVAEGELLVLLGPSGCGKTTMLRCIAGHESAQAGEITLDGATVFNAAGRVDLPPEKRRIGMVFQNYALWPHMTVRENIAFPLKAQKMKAEFRAGDAVRSVAGLVDCEQLLERYPGELSGGQQQRVALARGLVTSPKFMLFDEPLSNLDALLRAQVRHDLHELHGSLKFSGVYVTHDQTEAFAIGDRLAVMRAGKVEQIGTPQEIYGAPVTEYAANFVGMSNRLAFEATGDRWQLAGSDVQTFDLPLARDTEEVVIRCRPRDLEVLDSSASEFDGVVLDGHVTALVYEGGHYDLSVVAGSCKVNVHLDSSSGVPTTVGEPVRVGLHWGRGCWFKGGHSTVLPRLTVAARPL